MTPAETLEAALKAHDWYYSYSDDHQTWRAGDASRRQIDILMREVPAEVAVALLKKYQPKDL